MKENVHQPKQKAQWINPLFYNNDFENELNFPLWFEDSLVKAHDIYKITKRIFKEEELDSNGFFAIPNEKIEYYFDPNGYVDQLVIYSYLDDREISRANFIYEGNMLASGYRKVRALPLITLQKKNVKDEFATDFFLDVTNQYSLYTFKSKQKKYLLFFDEEKKNNVFVMKQEKYWGPLSIDSILHPQATDWVILGSIRKPQKRFQVENTVNYSNVYKYEYWKSGMIKARIKEIYPFTYKRSYIYKQNNDWEKYIDSTFSENEFLMRSVHKIVYDEYGRPSEIIHVREQQEGASSTYRETLSYRTRAKK